MAPPLFFIWALVLIIAFATQAVPAGAQSAQSTCTLQADIDFPGNDIARITSVNATNCCDLCNQQPGCRAFSYSNYLGGSCWLKKSKGSPSARKGVQSAEVNSASPPFANSTTTCNNLQNGVDFFGNDIGNTSSSTPVGCCAICNNRNGCRAFSWTNANGGTCWLKDFTGVSLSNPNVVSATLIANPPPTCSKRNGVATARGCCTICRATSGCKEFSWRSGTCLLKGINGTVATSGSSFD